MERISPRRAGSGRALVRVMRGLEEARYARRCVLRAAPPPLDRRVSSSRPRRVRSRRNPGLEGDGTRPPPPKVIREYFAATSAPPSTFALF